MTDKTEVIRDPSGPGPAKYILPSTVGHQKHDISRSRGPSFSMGIRLPGLFSEQKIQSPSPGPKYQVEYMTHFGKDNIPRVPGRPQSCKVATTSRRNSVNESPKRNVDNGFQNKTDEFCTKNSTDRKFFVEQETKSFMSESHASVLQKQGRISSARRFQSVPPKSNTERERRGRF